MNPETLKDRIRTCADLAGSCDALAEKSGIPRRTLKSYLSGSSEPKASRVAAIASAVGVSLDWLIKGEGPMRPAHKAAESPLQEVGEPIPLNPAHMRPVPVVGTTQGGPPDRVWLALDYPTGFGDGWIEAYTKDPNAYALRVVGSSMASRIVEGDILLVSPNTEPTVGEEVVARDTSGACMVKILSRLDEREAILSSVNDQYARIAIPREHIDILHAVVAIYRRSSLRH